MTANVATNLVFDPVMAMLSYANFVLPGHPRCNKVRDALRFYMKTASDLGSLWEVQMDFALNKGLCIQSKFPFF